jgi:hypothetical protein
MSYSPESFKDLKKARYMPNIEAQGSLLPEE